MPRYLLIDDKWTPTPTEISALDGPLTTVRNSRDAMKALKEGFEVVYLDHDLGESRNGYDLLKWMVYNMCESNWPKEFRLITANPVGFQNMRSILESIGYNQKAGNQFIKVPKEQ